MTSTPARGQHDASPEGNIFEQQYGALVRAQYPDLAFDFIYAAGIDVDLLEDSDLEDLNEGTRRLHAPDGHLFLQVLTRAPIEKHHLLLVKLAS